MEEWEILVPHLPIKLLFGARGREELSAAYVAAECSSPPAEEEEEEEEEEENNHQNPNQQWVGE
jgi:hypothetical protein